MRLISIVLTLLLVSGTALAAGPGFPIVVRDTLTADGIGFQHSWDPGVMMFEGAGVVTLEIVSSETAPVRLTRITVADVEPPIGAAFGGVGFWVMGFTSRAAADADPTSPDLFPKTYVPDLPAGAITYSVGTFGGDDVNYVELDVSSLELEVESGNVLGIGADGLGVCEVAFPDPLGLEFCLEICPIGQLNPCTLNLAGFRWLRAAGPGSDVGYFQIGAATGLNMSVRVEADTSTPPLPVPTLDGLGLGLLAVALLAVGVAVLRKRRPASGLSVLLVVSL